MSTLVEYGTQLLSGGVRTWKLLWSNLVLGGDFVIAFLIFVGLGALLFYLIAGLMFAEWSLTVFFARLTLGAGLGLLLAGAVAIACFALPIAAYLHDGLRSPLIILLVVLVG